MKYTVVHGGARDSYQLPGAFAEKDLLGCFVTDAYRSSDLVGTIIKMIPKSQLRFCDLLQEACIINDPRALITFLALSFSRRLLPLSLLSNLHQRQNTYLSLRSYKEAVSRNNTLLCTSYYAGPAFKKIDTFHKGKIRKLLFQIHPEPCELKKLYLEELEIQPLWASTLHAEKELHISENELEELALEPRLADKILVASSYTMETLLSQGIDKSKISISPYGVDFQKYNTTGSVISQVTRKGPIHVVFVGSLIQRKGISYLLDAVKKFSVSELKLVICTRWIPDKNILSRFDLKNVEIRYHLSEKELIDQYKISDLFILPSIAEGYAHVIGEAMACGLPILATENTMARDCVTSGVEGFTIPIRSSTAIEEKLAHLVRNRDLLRHMGENACTRIQTHTWSAFRERVRAFADAKDDQ